MELEPRAQTLLGNGNTCPYKNIATEITSSLRENVSEPQIAMNRHQSLKLDWHKGTGRNLEDCSCCGSGDHGNKLQTFRTCFVHDLCGRLCAQR